MAADINRDIVTLRDRGLTFSTIGKMLGMSKDSVQKRYLKLDKNRKIGYDPRILSQEVPPKDVDSSNTRNTYTSYGRIPHVFEPVVPVKVDYIARVGKPTDAKRGELVVAAGDFQFPFEDGDVFSAFLTFLATERPERIVLTGDILDLTSVSAYDKDPRLGLPVQQELARAHLRLSEIRSAAGKDASIFFVYGNHEARFSKWLSRKAPELVGLVDASGVELLSLANLLRLDTLNIQSCLSENVVFNGPEHLRSYYKVTEDLIATHGTYSRNSGGAASILPIAEAAGVSVVGGHDHSQGMAFRTVGGFAELPERKIVAISTGMMCQRTELGYLAQHQVSRWSAGFSVVELWGKKAGEWQADFASWTGSALAWRGRRYEPK